MYWQCITEYTFLYTHKICFPGLVNLDIKRHFISLPCKFAHTYKLAHFCLGTYGLKHNYVYLPTFFYTWPIIIFYTLLDCEDCRVLHVCPVVAQHYDALYNNTALTILHKVQYVSVITTASCPFSPLDYDALLCLCQFNVPKSINHSTSTEITLLEYLCQQTGFFFWLKFPI